MKYFYVLISLIFMGCAQVVVKEVPVPTPVKCQIELKPRPIQRCISPEYLREVLIYTEELERDLKFCIEGNIEK